MMFTGVFLTHQMVIYNPGHKYFRLVHILNEFFFHHKRSKGISNDIKSSWWNFIYICKKT